MSRIYRGISLLPPWIPGIFPSDSLFYATAQIYCPLSLYVSRSHLLLQLQGQSSLSLSLNIVPISPTNFLGSLPEMDLLEMPVEAIVLRFHSLPAAVAAGSLCACLAFLAAALGFWRVRVVGSRSDVSLPHSPTPPKPEQAQAPAPAPAAAPVRKSPEPTSRAPHYHMEDAGTPKARFTAYYGSCDRFDVEDDGDEQPEVDNGRKNDGASFVRSRLTAPLEGFGWEGLMVRRRGDLGWYRYQDLTALNGNVVRLWDGDGVWTEKSWRRSPMGL